MNSINRLADETTRLYESPSVTQTVLDLLPDSIAVLDRRGVVTTVNRAMRRFAFDEHTLEVVRVGNNFLELLRHSNSPYGTKGRTISQAVEEILNGSRDQFSVNFSHATHPNHPLLQFEIIAAREPDRGAVVTHRPVPSTNGSPKENSSREYQVDSLIRSLPLAVITLDSSLKIQEWNGVATRIFGWTEQEVIGKLPPYFVEGSANSQFSPDANIAPILASEISYRRKDESLVELTQWIVPQRDLQGRLNFLVFFADNTERRQLEEQFRQAQKMESIGRLVGGVAHDFNNLLTVISGYTDLLLEDLRQDFSSIESLQAIRSASERAAALTNQLLSFSRKQVFEPNILDLNAIVAESGKLLKRLVGEDIELVTTLDSKLGRVKADLGQIQQVLMNLVVNARDAMPRGGRITVETSNFQVTQVQSDLLGEMKPGSYIKLQVSDTGVGMDDRTKSRIFEPFFTTKEKGKGTGLGLATVHGIVRQSQGHLSVYSEPGRGSCFQMYLPEVDFGLLVKQHPTPVEDKPSGTETILFVEDDAEVLAFSGRVLKSCGYTVLEATNGSDAVSLAEKYPGAIHLLITDVVMPVMGGRQSAEFIQSSKPGIRVLYVSGYTDDAVLRHGVIGSETTFLQKPYSPNSLAQKVRLILDE